MSRVYLKHTPYSIRQRRSSLNTEPPFPLGVSLSARGGGYKSSGLINGLPRGRVLAQEMGKIAEYVCEPSN
jgi:hypothetical protein